METKTDVNVRYNLASLVGYNSAMMKIVCRKLEYVLDNPQAYYLGDLTKSQIIQAVEQLKESYRISEHLFDLRNNQEYDFTNLKEIKNQISNQNKPNENGRTNNLDA
jgi:ribosomal protein S13